MTEVEKIIAEVWCPGCGALPGSRCVSLRLGEVYRTTVHQARAEEATGRRRTGPSQP